MSFTLYWDSYQRFESYQSSRAKLPSPNSRTKPSVWQKPRPLHTYSVSGTRVLRVWMTLSVGKRRQPGDPNDARHRPQTTPTTTHIVPISSRDPKSPPKVSVTVDRFTTLVCPFCRQLPRQRRLSRHTVSVPRPPVSVGSRPSPTIPSRFVLGPTPPKI